MASFSAYLYLEGRVYGIAWCCYIFHQYVDQRGRPRSKVRKGPLYLELYALEDCADLTEWAQQSHKTLSGKIVFTRGDADAPLKHLWFTHAHAVGFLEAFDSRGTSGESSLRIRLIISPEDMGVGAGGGEGWVAPLARAYAYVPPAPVAPPATVVAAPPLPLPPHLPAPIPNPSPDHKQVHLSAQQWQDLIKGRWDRDNNKSFLKHHRLVEFHVDGDPFTYRTDNKGKVEVVYDTQKSYNTIGTRKGITGVPLTMNGEPTFAGTQYMYPPGPPHKTVVVIDMGGSRKVDFKRANEAAGLDGSVKAQGLKSNQPPKGYTWHHRDDFIANDNPPPYGTCTMELVRKDAHEGTFVHHGSCDQCNKHFADLVYD